MNNLTNKEILEACAMSCGIRLKWDDDYPYRIKCTGNSKWWNPLEDDGDCARLESRCGVVVDCFIGYSKVSIGRDGTIYEVFTPGKDPERRKASCLVVARAQIEK